MESFPWYGGTFARSYSVSIYLHKKNTNEHRQFVPLCDSSLWFLLNVLPSPTGLNLEKIQPQEWLGCGSDVAWTVFSDVVRTLWQKFR